MPPFLGRAVERRRRSNDRRTFWICRHRQIARTQSSALVSYARNSVARYRLYPAVRDEDRNSEACPRPTWWLRREHHLRGLHALAPRSVSIVRRVRSDLWSAMGQALRHRAGTGFVFPLDARPDRSPSRHAPPARQSRPSSQARIRFVAVQDSFSSGGTVAGYSWRLVLLASGERCHHRGSERPH